MSIFEFRDDVFEAGTPTASRPAPAPSRPPAGGGASSRPPAPRPAGPTGGATSGARPAPQPAPRPMLSGGAGTRAAPGPSPRPAPSPSPRPSPQPSGGGRGRPVDFSSLFRQGADLFSQARDIVQFGTQTAQQFRQMGQQFGWLPPSQGAPGPAPADAGQQPYGPVPYGQQPYGPQPFALQPYGPQPYGLQPYGAGAAGPGMPGASVDQLAMLMQALQQRQIPPLPGAPPPSAPAAPMMAPSAAMQGPAMAPPGVPAPMGAPAPAPTPMAQPRPPQADALALLHMILANPQFQQAMQQAAVSGYSASRSVALPIPSTTNAPAPMREVPVPLGAVLNAVSALSEQAMSELNAGTREDDPEVPSYLVGDDGGFIVDPTSPNDRAALVAHLFSISDQAQRLDGPWPSDNGQTESDAEMDESESWAHAAGLTR